MRTDEELKEGWKVFSDKMPVMVREGSLRSSYAFIRLDTLPDGGMTTAMIAYNLTEESHLGMLAYQLQSVSNYVHRGNDPNRKHSISRVLNLFNRLFGVEGDVTGLKSNLKKDLN